jgi:hypothetical protein
MSKIITACNIKFSKKDGIYIISTEFKDGVHEGGQSGAKVYCVGNYLVQTSWGAAKPIAVYKSEEEMLLNLEQNYKVKPELERI